jgi:hypothetical protein
MQCPVRLAETTVLTQRCSSSTSVFKCATFTLKVVYYPVLYYVCEPRL